MSFTIDIFPPEQATPDSWSLLTDALVVVAQPMGFQGLEEWSVDVTDMILAKADEHIDLRPRDVKPIRVYFETADKAREFRTLIKEKQPRLQISKPKKMAEKDWNEAWKKFYKPQQLGEILVVPAWTKSQRENTVFIHPGAAFGAGTHPTTQMCIGLMQRLPRLIGVSVLDFGAGTGILALAAKRWFANTTATCVEIEEPARELIVRNADLNDTHVEVRDNLPKAKYDLCFANILLPVLEEYAKDIAVRVLPGGYVILSGILLEDEAALLAAYKPWFRAEVIAHDDGWSAIMMKRRAN